MLLSKKKKKTAVLDKDLFPFEKLEQYENTHNASLFEKHI